MILFESDIERYPNAVLDLNTPNKSFLRFSALLREMGVKNHLFFLYTLDPDLIGVDPYDPDLPPEYAIKIGVECADNFWYFIRMVARDPSGSPDAPILFEPNRGIMSAYWLYFNHVVPFLTLIRQTGKSFGLSWLSTWLLNLGMSKAEVSFITKDDKLRSREVERLKAMELTLPHYLKQRKSTEPGNTEVIKIGNLDNYFKLYVANKSPKMADVLGRGMTSPTVLGDEFSYLWCNWVSIPVMLSATLAAREVAKKTGNPYGNIFASTSGKRDTPEGRYAYNFMMGSAIWTERFYDAKDEQTLHDMVLAAAPAKRLRVNCTFNHRQLGKSDEWLRQRLKDAEQEDPIQIQCDFFNTWPSGTQSSPFTQDVANAIRASEVLDYYTEISGVSTCYSLRWYYQEHEIKRQLDDPHVLAVDPSDAVGQDAIGNVLRNAITGEVAMAADISESNLISYCQWLVAFLVEYKNVTVIVERRGQGATIIDYLLMYLPTKGENPFLRLYNKIIQEKDEYPLRYRDALKSYRPGEPYVDPRYKVHFGWATSASGTTSRAELYSKTLLSAAKMTGKQVRDRKLILQMLGLTTRNNRIDHEEGEHDDLVICFLLSYWLLYLGKNLREYGLEPHRILSKNPTYLENIKVKSSYEQMQNERAKRDVELLSEQIRNETDEYVARRLEYDLIRAINQLTEQDRQIVAADDLLNRLREERARHARKQAYVGNSAYY